jgi:hypothetical protein
MKELASKLDFQKVGKFDKSSLLFNLLWKVGTQHKSFKKLSETRRKSSRFLCIRKPLVQYNLFIINCQGTGKKFERFLKLNTLST